jgi:integrase
MAYAEKRDGKLTGGFYGEALVTPKGKPQKRFRRRFDTMKAAQGYETYVKLMGEEPPTLQPLGTGRTFREVAEDCKKAGGPKKKWHAGRDCSIIQRVDYCVSVIGDVDIGDVTRDTMEQIVESLEKRPPSATGKLRGPQAGADKLSPATINRYLNAAGAVLQFAVLNRVIPFKPAIPLLPEKQTRRKRAILQSYDQEDAILRVMESRGHHVEAVCVRVLVETGLRLSELLTRLTPAQIIVEQEGEEAVGWLVLHEDQTKNNDARTVYIRPELAREIRAIIASGQLPKRYRLLNQFKTAAKICGYPSNLVIHSLRHTRNTRLRKQGVDMKIRMQMLGHKSIQASMMYDHVDTEDQLEAAKKVERSRGDRAPAETARVLSITRSA